MTNKSYFRVKLEWHPTALQKRRGIVSSGWRGGNKKNIEQRRNTKGKQMCVQILAQQRSRGCVSYRNHLPYYQSVHKGGVLSKA